MNIQILAAVLVLLFRLACEDHPVSGRLAVPLTHRIIVSA